MDRVIEELFRSVFEHPLFDRLSRTEKTQAVLLVAKKCIDYACDERKF